MTPADLLFRTWLMAQPDDRVFSTDTCGCPLACFGKEVLGFADPQVGFESVRDVTWACGTGIQIPSAFKPVAHIWKTTETVPAVTAQQFRQLYEESNS